MKIPNNLPNKLTVLRIALTPVFVFVVLSNIITVEYRDFFSAILFVVIASTDALDGFIARHYNNITTFGEYIDPIADKILLTSAMVVLVFLQRLSLYIFIILVIRDFIMSGVRIIAKKDGVDISAKKLGKIKTIFEAVVVAFLLFNLSFPFNEVVSCILIVVTVIIAVVSCIQYIGIYRNAICTSWNEIKCGEKGKAGVLSGNE